MSGELEDTTSVIQALFKELDLGDVAQGKLTRDFSQDFGELLNLPAKNLSQLGFDAAVVLAVSGDWEMASEICRQLIARTSDDRVEIKILQLRAFIELERFPEALALSTSNRWPSEWLIHVNYLTGEAFEGLRMFDEARLRFDAVFKLNNSYRNVAQKITQY